MTTIDVGPLILGGNVFGWTADRDATFAVLDAFVAAGGSAIDTADVYSAWAPGHSGGESETVIGQWLAARPGAREKVVIGTKVYSLPQRAGLSPDNIAAAAEDSLRRLQTDYIDIYYAHRDDESVEQAAYLAAFDALAKRGLIRSVGVSNFSVERVQSAIEVTKANNLTPISFAQDEYNLVERGLEQTLLPVLIENDIAEVPYFSLAAGFLTGKYRPGTTIESARAGKAAPYLENPRAVALLSVLDDIAAAHSAPVTAVSLAWLRAQPGVAAPIASARTPEQLAELAASFTLELTADELNALNEASA